MLQTEDIIWMCWKGSNCSNREFNKCLFEEQHQGSVFLHGSMIIYLYSKDPLGGHGDCHAVVRVHERRSAVWPASGPGSPFWTSSHGPDPGGAGGGAARPNCQGSCAANAIIQTNGPAHEQGCGQCSVNNQRCSLVGPASKCFAEGHYVFDRCCFNNQVSYIHHVTEHLHNWSVLIQTSDGSLSFVFVLISNKS